MRHFRSALLWLCLGAGLGAQGTAFALETQIAVDGSELVVTLEDGRVLRREGLIGLKLVVASDDRDIQARIDGIEEDRTVPEEPLTLYRLSTRDPKTGETGDMCQPDPQGRRAVLVYPDGAGGFTLTCTSGAEGKCIVLGYRPWQDRQGIPMRDLHRACIHMIRADYGGDDRPTTRDGTLVNIYDRFGILDPDPKAGTTFEAAWGPDGAICVAHPRIPDNVSLEQLAERYPRLRGRLGPQACSAEAARSDPQALLFNESLLVPRS